ncbi:MAG: GNAT family N-acetyltransferase [Devosia sp.]
MTTRSSWLQKSTKDSERFGIRIFRGTINGHIENPSRLVNDIIESKADLVVVRVPAGDVTLPFALANQGVSPVHADTLVYYERDAKLPAIELSSNFPFEFHLANEADRSSLSTLATLAFSSYRSHYHANPELDPATIAAGYGEWAASCIAGSFDEQQRSLGNHRETWTVRFERKIIAFATCAINNPEKSAEVLLNAVNPHYSGQGVYSNLLREVVSVYQQRDMACIRISTQVWNYTVQRAWVRQGFLLTHAYDTYHLHLNLGTHRTASA